MIKEVLQGSCLVHALPSFISRWMIKRAIPKIRRESKADTVFFCHIPHSWGQIPVEPFQFHNKDFSIQQK